MVTQAEREIVDEELKFAEARIYQRLKAHRVRKVYAKIAVTVRSDDEQEACREVAEKLKSIEGVELTSCVYPHRNAKW